MVREVSASGRGRPEAKGGKQSRHLEKEHPSRREGQVYWPGQKLTQKAKRRGKEYLRGQDTLLTPPQRLWLSFRESRVPIC